METLFRLSSGLHQLPDHLVSEVAARHSHPDVVFPHVLQLQSDSLSRAADRLRLCGDVNPQPSLVVSCLVVSSLVVPTAVTGLSQSQVPAVVCGR